MRKLFLILVFCVSCSLSSMITSSPGLKRRHVGDTCEFQWTVTGDVTSHSIKNHSTGTPLELGSNANHSIRTEGGVHFVSLSIWSITLQDAGNYSLTVTAGTRSTTDAGALLFVYGVSSSSTVSPNTTLPATEGNSIALSCSVATTSRPSNSLYRPRIYYHWILSGTNGGRLRNISNGHPTLASGEVLPRHFIQDDGRTLVIESLQFSDQQNYRCWGQEEGSRYTSELSSTNLLLTLNYRPVITSTVPASRKFNADIGQTVTLLFNYNANPSVSALPSWTLTDTTGVHKTLPGEFSSVTLTNPIPNPITVSFILTAEHYGKYSFGIGNSVGTTNDFFNVLPPGPPDEPSNLIVRFRTFNLISISWNCMWFNGRQQTAMLQLKDTGSSVIVDTYNFTESSNDCFNQSRSLLFEKDLHPDRGYEVLLWSNNSLGSSDIIKLPVRTTKRFQLLLSRETISIRGNEATINFETLHGNMTSLKVTYCVEDSGRCDSREFKVDASSSEVVMKNLPAGLVYLFDFNATGEFLGSKYFLGIIKGVKVHRDGNPTDPLQIKVNVLASVLALSLLALLGCLVAFLYVKLRRPRNEDSSLETLEDNSKMTEMKPPKVVEKPAKIKEQEVQKPVTKNQRQVESRGGLPEPKTKAPRRRTQQPPPLPSPSKGEEVDTQETYEAMDRNDEANEGEMYTPLDQPQPQRKQKRNLYS